LAVFLAGVFFAVDVDFVAGLVFLAVLEAFFAVLVPEVFLAAEDVDFVAVPAPEVFFAVVFFAVLFDGVDLLAAFEAVAFEAVAFEAVAFEVVALVAVDFDAAALDAVDLLGADFEADDFVVLFLAVEVFFAGALPPVALLAAPAVLRTAGLAADGVALEAAASVSLGSFLAPETTAFRSAPALNLGTAVFLALIRSPVRGFRTQRASRTLFSNEPNPVIATFSPLATSRVMVSSTDSSACEAALRLPSYRAARASIS
jgi:hypothetical protein